jgi:hypothetical protein
MQHVIFEGKLHMIENTVRVIKNVPSAVYIAILCISSKVISNSIFSLFFKDYVITISVL